MSTQRALHIAERIFLLIGLVLLGVLLHQLGVQTVVRNLRLVGWGIVPLILQEALSFVANTMGWLAAFPRWRPTRSNVSRNLPRSPRSRSSPEAI